MTIFFAEFLDIPPDLRGPRDRSIDNVKNRVASFVDRRLELATILV